MQYDCIFLRASLLYFSEPLGEKKCYLMSKTTRLNLNECFRYVRSSSALTLTIALVQSR